MSLQIKIGIHNNLRKCIIQKGVFDVIALWLKVECPFVSFSDTVDRSTIANHLS